MTSFFVSKSGSDANNGLGPDASAGTNKPWLTVGKALTGGMASGDTLYICAGTYREAITVTITPTATTSIIADYLNAQGFKDSSGNLLSGGEIRWTAYTTDDKSAPGTFACKLNGKNFLSFSNIHFVGGSNANNGACVDGTTVASSHDITFTSCAFTSGSNLGGVALISLTGRVDNTSTYTFDSCLFGPGGNANACHMGITLPTSTTADYDAACVIKNCSFLGGGSSGGVDVLSSGANSFKGGGVTFSNCYGLNSTFKAGASGTNVSVAFPLLVSNSVLQGDSLNNVLAGTSAGQVVEDYNILWGGTPRSTTVTAGPFSTVSGNYSQLLSYGQEAIWGGRLRQFGTPLSGSPVLGFGNAVLAPGRAPTMADDTTVGTISWTNPSNAATPSDSANAIATAIPATTGVSHYLKATAYAGFTGIPSDATIKSIRVEALVSASAGSSVSCNSIKLVKAGTISGNDLASSNTTQFTTSSVANSWGNTSDPLWGLSLAPSDVQASNFGVVFSAKNVNASTRDCSIDFLRIIVAYTTSDGAGGVATDMLGRPRPAGGASATYAVGPLERWDSSSKEITNTDGGTGASLKLPGPGGADFSIPVDATSTTISVKYKTASYSGTNYPQAILLAAGDIGVSTETKTASGTSDSSFSTLTFTPFTPSSQGVVTVRLVNRTGDGAGVVYFDTLNSA